MRVFSRILCSLLLLFIWQHVSYDVAFAKTSTYQVTPDSNQHEIKKLQVLFHELGLYYGQIDGKYTSIRPSLIEYQIQSDVIDDISDVQTGYVGADTLEALKRDFPESLRQAVQKAQALPVEKEIEERKFVVTAYYSPLRGQDKYVKGSYAADIRLNGRGTHGASGKAVHPGFLAAPKNYSFGTKIYLEGLGVGVVEDRGGAIVNAGQRGYQYDRIDVWMGYGDEGRIRALKWGKRTVKGEFVDADTELTIAFGYSPIDKYADLKVDGQNPKTQNVQQLQELFAEIGKYNGNINGEFDDIREVLIDFQVKKSVISSRESEEAGYFGPKTLAALRQEYAENLQNPDSIAVQRELIELSKNQQKTLDAMVDQIQSYALKKSSGDSDRAREILDRIASKLENIQSKQTKQIRKLQIDDIISHL